MSGNGTPNIHSNIPRPMLYPLELFTVSSVRSYVNISIMQPQNGIEKRRRSAPAVGSHLQLYDCSTAHGDRARLTRP
jgi:hypothetical protein